MSIRLDRASAPAGAIHVEVITGSRRMKHEMLIFAVAGPAAPLPYDSWTRRLPEDRLQVKGEASDLAPGDVQALDITLATGHCLLLCNIAGNYEAGMAVQFKVTP